MMLSFLAQSSLLVTAAAAVGAPPLMFAGRGYDGAAYSPLLAALSEVGDVCVGHSPTGGREALGAASLGAARCAGGVVLLGAAPLPADLVGVPASKVLVIGGTLDGVVPLSHQAVSRHRSPGIRHAAVPGASHHSFASGPAPPAVAALDLAADVTATTVHRAVAAVVRDFVRGDGPALAAAEALADQLAGPVVDALKLEGSAALGVEVCNSDFPTNPSCPVYAKYPDFSLPPGPAKPPAPLPTADCVCGSEWVRTVASPIVAGTRLQGFAVAAADAFHDVSDTHPFHLPHIWNTCKAPSGCTLNVTTVTMPVLKAGSLFPNASAAPLSAFELRVKLKSRQETWQAAGLGKQSGGVDKNNMTMCRDINNAAYDWALANAEPSVRARFLAEGEPLVMVADKEATIGITGPQWIKDELVYTRKAGPGSGGSGNRTSHVEIQSWTFVVGSFPVKSKYLPAGMHYCKLLSPARAMEWIYTDSLRQHRSAIMSSATAH